MNLKDKQNMNQVIKFMFKDDIAQDTKLNFRNVLGNYLTETMFSNQYQDRVLQSFNQGQKTRPSSVDKAKRIQEFVDIMINLQNDSVKFSNLTLSQHLLSFE